MIIMIESGTSWEIAAGTDTASLIANLRNAMASDDVITLPVKGQNTEATVLLRARTVMSVFVGDLPTGTFKSGVLRLGGVSPRDSGAGSVGAGSVGGGGEWRVADASITEIVNTLERGMRDRIVVEIAIPGGVLLANGALLDTCFITA